MTREGAKELLSKTILKIPFKEIWLARDKNNTLCIYDGESKPIKDKVIDEWLFGNFIGFLPNDYFPEIQWSDVEPTKAKLIIDI